MRRWHRSSSRPTVAVHASFLAAMDEFRADGAESAPHSTLAHELTTWHSTLADRPEASPSTSRLIGERS